MSKLSDSKIMDLYEHERLSCAEISEIDGRSEGTMYNILKARGIEIRSRSVAKCKFSTKIAIILYNLGLSGSQSGRILGVHSTTILKRLGKIGFPLRSRTMASNIKYSEQEFEKHFNTSEFTELLNQQEVGVNG